MFNSSSNAQFYQKSNYADIPTQMHIQKDEMK